MAYLTLARIAGDPEWLVAGYDRTATTMAEVGRDHGLILHAAAPTPEGLLMVNVWRSAVGSEAAARDPRRRSVMAQHGLDPSRIRREHHFLANLVHFLSPEVSIPAHAVRL